MDTNRKSVDFSFSWQITSILCATSLMGIPQEVVSQKNLTQMTTTSELIDTTDTELFKGVERQVPNELWSQHDSDVEIVKSANPVGVRLKPDVHLPRKRAGRRTTFECLLKAGELIEITSYFNTPIMLVIKANENIASCAWPTSNQWYSRGYES